MNPVRVEGGAARRPRASRGRRLGLSGRGLDRGSRPSLLRPSLWPRGTWSTRCPEPVTGVPSSCPSPSWRCSSRWCSPVSCSPRWRLPHHGSAPSWPRPTRSTNRPSRHRCHPVPPCRCTASVSCGPARSRRWSTDWTWTWPKGNGYRSRRTERIRQVHRRCGAGPVHRPAQRLRLGGTDAGQLGGSLVVRGVVTWCPQSPWLADTSLRANLRIADPEVTESTMWHVLDRVRMSDWAHRAPRRARHHARTDGATLSGGQRQRLALARVSWPTTGWWCWTSRQPTWTPTPPRPCWTTYSSHFGGPDRHPAGPR